MKGVVCAASGFGVGAFGPSGGCADTNHTHATQGDSTKSMKAFTKQEKTQQKTVEENREEGAEKRQEKGGEWRSGWGLSGQ